jgi:hypothetical protein
MRLKSRLPAHESLLLIEHFRDLGCQHALSHLGPFADQCSFSPSGSSADRTALTVEDPFSRRHEREGFSHVHPIQ